MYRRELVAASLGLEDAADDAAAGVAGVAALRSVSDIRRWRQTCRIWRRLSRLRRDAASPRVFGRR